MSGGIEAAGDVATGALLGRAVEPRAGEGHGTADGICLNCGTALIGDFCHACGQLGHVHKTLGSIGHDLLHGVFHFEGKIWRTLPMLALHPGRLTRRYIDGERARFVSPLALFLFCVFLMFAVFESVGPPIRPRATVLSHGATLNEAQVRAEQARVTARIAALKRDRAAALTAHRSTQAIDDDIERLSDDAVGLSLATRINQGVSIGDLPRDVPIHTSSTLVDERLRHAFANPALLIYRLQSSAYKFAWALIPLSLPFVWGMFAWKRRYRPYDHAVFITYSLSAVMLLLIVMAVLAAIGLSADWALMLIPVHAYRQLRGAYEIGWLGALWRTIMLMMSATIVLAAFSILMVVLALD